MQSKVTSDRLPNGYADAAGPTRDEQVSGRIVALSNGVAGSAEALRAPAASSGHIDLQLGSLDDLHHAIQGWSLDFRQLDPGNMRGRLAQIGDAQSIATSFSSDRHLEQRGQAPPGMITFGLVPPGVSLRWHGMDLSDDSLEIFDDLEAVSMPGFTALTLSISLGRLIEAERFTELRLPDESLLTGVHALRADPRALARLRRFLQLTLSPTTPEDARWGHLGVDLPSAVLHAISPDAREIRRPISRVRDMARKRAIEFIEAHPDEALSVRDVCRGIGVGQRTLQYAFVEHFGVSPKSYMRAIRLNAVRRALHEVDPRTTIASVANAWGFWHMGQFAADYRKLFGELPSESLARTNRVAPSRVVARRQPTTVGGGITGLEAS